MRVSHAVRHDEDGNTPTAPCKPVVVPNPTVKFKGLLFYLFYLDTEITVTVVKYKCPQRVGRIGTLKTKTKTKRRRGRRRRKMMMKMNGEKIAAVHSPNCSQDPGKNCSIL